MDPKFARRQREAARQQQQEMKRAEKAARRNHKGRADDGIAAIQAALDAGLNPGMAVPVDESEVPDLTPRSAEPSVPRESTTGTRLYVGNLSFRTSEADLRAAFEEGGRRVADVKIMTDRDTGQPRGFAFVEMGSSADSDAAIAAMDGYNLDGRVLRVNVAEDRPRGGGFRGGGGGFRGRR
jgi:hypothetical protein